MRKFLLWLMLLLLTASTACAAEYFNFTQPVLPGLYDRECSVTYTRVRSGGGSGVLMLLDENGNVLGQTKVNAGKEIGTIKIGITPDMPLAQTIQLVFQQEDETTLQDECILAADDVKKDGLRIVETDEKKIAITFDSASGVGKLAELLDLLDELDIKCTFFLQGEFVLNHSEWAAEIFARGHELANHSMHHPNMRDIDNARVYREITRCNELIEEITGTPVTLYRPPSGYYSYRDRVIGRALGCEMILWTFDSMDGFTDSTRQKIWKAMTTKSEPGAIILMHIYGKHTLSILEEYVPLMREQGYEFVTVTDLMPAGGVLDQEGVMRLPEGVL